jgi:outer membrane murein-binding lipoprotein Lpp
MSTTPRPTSKELRKYIDDVLHQIEEKEGEIRAIRREAESAAITAILTGGGKNTKAQQYAEKARAMQEAVDRLKAGFQNHSAALQLIEAEEAKAREQAEAAQVAELTQKHRAAVRGLIEAIETGGSDLTAAARIQQAEIDIAEIFFQFPQKKRPQHIIVQNPSMITVDEQMRMNFFTTLCNIGFSDLFPATHAARRVFEHSQAHDRSQSERLERERRQRKATADQSLIPDELPEIPNRQPRMTFR